MSNDAAFISLLLTIGDDVDEFDMTLARLEQQAKDALDMSKRLITLENPETLAFFDEKEGMGKQIDPVSSRTMAERLREPKNDGADRGSAVNLSAGREIRGVLRENEGTERQIDSNCLKARVHRLAERSNGVLEGVSRVILGTEREISAFFKRSEESKSEIDQSLMRARMDRLDERNDGVFDRNYGESVVISGTEPESTGGFKVNDRKEGKVEMDFRQARADKVNDRLDRENGTDLLQARVERLAERTNEVFDEDSRVNLGKERKDRGVSKINYIKEGELELTSAQAKIGNVGENVDEGVARVISLFETDEDSNSAPSTSKNQKPSQTHHHRAGSDLATRLHSPETRRIELETDKQTDNVEALQIKLEQTKQRKHELETLLFSWHRREQKTVNISRLDSILNMTRHNMKRAEVMNKTCALNEAFFIWHAGVFGTINGARLGTTIEESVEWHEINAAWGFAALLLDTMAREVKFDFFVWRVSPRGSQSVMTNMRSEPMTLSLYCHGGFFKSGFNAAMGAFADCIDELGEFAKRDDIGFVMPYAVGRAHVGGLSVHYSESIEWTRAMKYLLTDLKYLLAWVVKRKRVLLPGSAKRN